MSKRKPLKIILLVLLALPGLVFWYLFFMPSLLKLPVIIKEANSVPELQYINLERSKPGDGLKVNAYGYTLTLQGHKSIVESTASSNYTRGFFVDNNNAVILVNPNDKDTVLNMQDKFYDGYFGRSLVALTGGRRATDYECYHIYYSASINDISIFDNNKDNDLYNLISIKSFTTRAFTQPVLEFKSDDIQGFILIGGTDDRPLVEAEVFRKEDLNKMYPISFLGFNQQEAISILSTLQFDGQ